MNKKFILEITYKPLVALFSILLIFTGIAFFAAMIGVFFGVVLYAIRMISGF